MNINKSEKKNVWLYAIILFTCAFIVLLLTAYSQEKLQKNTSEYQTQLSQHKKEQKNIITNLNDAITQNEKLKDEIEILKDEVEISKSDTRIYKEKIDDINKKYLRILELTDILIKASDEYYNGKIVEAALMIKEQPDFDILTGNAYEKYKFLVDATYVKAANILYTDGIKSYYYKKYSEAIIKLQNALSLAPYEYFSDDCLYYIAYSQYKNNDKVSATKTIEDMLVKYPESQYKKDAEDLLKILD